MKLFLMMPVEAMEAMLKTGTEWQLPDDGAIFASSLACAWELATCKTGRTLKVTPSTINESQTPKKKQRVAGDGGSGESPSKLHLLSLLGEPMALLQVERDVSELLSEWTQHDLGSVLGQTGFAPQGRSLRLQANDLSCSLHETMSLGSWTALVALSTYAELIAARTGIWPAAAPVAIPAPVAAAEQEGEQTHPADPPLKPAPSSPASSSATLVFGCAAPECGDTFYIATTTFFLADLMSAAGDVSRITLGPDNFKTLQPPFPGHDFVPLFKDEKTATFAVHLHASGQARELVPQWNRNLLPGQAVLLFYQCLRDCA